MNDMVPRCGLTRIFGCDPKESATDFQNKDDGAETCKRVPGTSNPRHISRLCQGGRDRSSDEGTAGSDAARFHRDDDERLWTGDVEI